MTWLQGNILKILREGKVNLIMVKKFLTSGMNLNLKAIKNIFNVEHESSFVNYSEIVHTLNFY